jgi:tRNA-Thr(GGU) m(6)t(6)A37 methyltransferase TsaA
MSINAIGVIHTPFLEATGTPIQPRYAEGVEGWIEVFEQFVPGLRDLEGFERIWLLYWFDRASFEDGLWVVKPYLDDNVRGVFATRAPSRPNPIGMSAVQLLEVCGNRLTVQEVDILDGTPLLDIKPYIPPFDCFEVSRSGWVKDAHSRKALADNRFERKTRGKS